MKAAGLESIEVLLQPLRCLQSFATNEAVAAGRDPVKQRKSRASTVLHTMLAHKARTKNVAVADLIAERRRMVSMSTTVREQREARVVVGVLNWNGWMDTIKCITSLLETDYSLYEVIVLDNGSSDDSVARLRQWARSVDSNADPMNAANTDVAIVRSDRQISISVEGGTNRVRLAISPENLGFADGCNVIARIARGSNPQFLWLLNNDAIVGQGTLGALLDVARESHAVVGSLVLSAGDNGVVQFARGRLPHDMFGWVPWRTRTDAADWWASDWVTFASVLVPFALIERRFRECKCFLDGRLFMYVEDVEFCLYARSVGAPIVVSRAGAIHHRISASSRGKAGARPYYYITRNRLLVVQKWFSRPLRAAFLVYYLFSRIALLVLHAFRLRWRNVRAIFEGTSDGLVARDGIWRRH